MKRLFDPSRLIGPVTRRLLPAAGVFTALMLIATPAAAQQRTAVGMIDSETAFIRSGPSDKDYAVLRLSRGQQLTAVGQKFGWLKILPPEGAFCYVGKAFVERRGSGDIGRVTAPCNVRWGSQLVEIKNKLATRLEPGVDVKIIGEEAEYFLIAPPQDVFLYVAKEDVVPAPAQAAAGATDDAETARGETPAPAEIVTPPAPQGGLAEQAGLPEDVVVNAPEANPALDAFEALDERARATAELPLEEQPIDELAAGYADLLEQDLPDSFRQVAQARLETYQIRQQALADFRAVEKMRQELAQKRQALAAEQAELEQRIAETTVRSYAALGTIRSSSLQLGDTKLYRLTDPATGRTLVYVRTNDPKIALMMGQFVGVEGSVTDDQQMRLRYVSPTRIERVAMNEVFKNVAADIVPPSLLSQNATAQTPTE